jgi:hypothetical protein
MDAEGQLLQRPGFGLTVEQIRIAIVWLMFASSFVVTIEPAPCDLLIILAFVFYIFTGLKVTVTVLPLIAFLLFYNFGGLLSLIPVFEDPKAQMFLITSTYMAISAIFFACYIVENPDRRMAIIKSGYIFGATLAALCGLLGYFNVAGLSERFTLEGYRAMGAFKDPNVFSTYLVLPAVMLMQDFMLGIVKRRFLSACALLLMVAAIFLAFSRGAWINVALSTTLMVGFTFLLTPSVAMRGRIVFFAIFGAFIFAVILGVLLSIPAVRELALDRFTLVKNYDAGETGRFGNQLNAIPLLLTKPLGFGPSLFSSYFKADPHNTFLNGFSSYGWIGGISYFILILATLTITLRSILTKSPWQNHCILVGSCFMAVIFQGVQIDTDHWRHFYWMLGLAWGLFAATLHVQTKTSHLA